MCLVAKWMRVTMQMFQKSIHADVWLARVIDAPLDPEQTLQGALCVPGNPGSNTPVLMNVKDLHSSHTLRTCNAMRSILTGIVQYLAIACSCIARCLIRNMESVRENEACQQQHVASGLQVLTLRHITKSSLAL